MLRAGQKFGKYRIRKRIARGGFGDVYEAHDTIEGIGVALKTPLGGRIDDETLADFRREVKLAARLDHPNILPIKNADFIDDNFVIAYPLGQETVADRLQKRMSVRTLLDITEQLLAALAHAHEHHIIHCDIKPENLILFADGRLRLTDFGIAKVAAKTIHASASGSLGYMAPEQALGQPSARSDVFSAGLLIYRMFTGELPEWPFDWPPPGIARLKRHGVEFTRFVQRALQVNTRKRYRDATQMLAAFRSVKPKVIRHAARRRNGARGSETDRDRDWRKIRLRQFKQRYGKDLKLDHTCGSCGEPVDERMQACPWCAATPLELVGESSFPRRCPRCDRGVKLDWHYCPWCYGAKIGPESQRSYTDRRYSAKCQQCKKALMPFMRYCPWCRTKVRRRWKLDESPHVCAGCGQRVAKGFWSSCAWCGTELSDG
jgi:eukaryotic-like serine/threonine-protein kinase